MNQEKQSEKELTGNPVEQFLRELPLDWKWLLALGLFMLVTGTLGLGMSVVLTLVSMLFFGVLLLIAGILQMLQALQEKEKRWSGRAQQVFIAVLYMVTAGLIFWDPVAASQGMTVVLAALFSAIGLTRIIHAVRCQRRRWKWVLPVLLGLINLALAAMILAAWPVSGLWVIGLFLSIELIMNGWFITLLALRVKKQQTV
jgi:uncharacterized membrane protein HdeD (DUF308 family)